MQIAKDLKYSTYDACLLDIYSPEQETNDVFLYFHGGGLENGDKRDIRFHGDLVEKGVILASANYRMYPDAKFPDFLEDAAQAVAFLQKRYPNKRLFVGGSSAGGYISMMLCFDDRYLLQAGVKPDSVAGYVHDAGQPTTHFNVLRERGLDTQRLIIDEAAPAYFVGLKEKCPPMLIFVADNDMHCRLEQTQMLCKTLEYYKLGYELKLMHSRHCGYVNKQEEDGRYLYADLLYDFLKKACC